MCSAPPSVVMFVTLPPDGVVTRGVGGVADGDGHSGVPFDVAHLLVRLDRVDDHVGTIRVDPGLGRLRRAVRHQRGDEARVRASHQLDESVREIHGDDASAGTLTLTSRTFSLGAQAVPNVSQRPAGDLGQAFVSSVAGQSVNVAWTDPHGPATDPLSANATGTSVPSFSPVLP